MLSPTLWTLLTVSFDEQKSLNLILFNLSFPHLHNPQSFLCDFLYHTSLHQSLAITDLICVTIALLWYFSECHINLNVQQFLAFTILILCLFFLYFFSHATLKFSKLFIFF